ncbi:ATP-binding cassette domain-containing protein [Streptomyces umbrinus]
MSGVHAGAAHPAATRTAPAIVLENVSKTYAGGVHALDDVSLAVEHGTFLAVMGPSGSGKSTLMHCAAGLDSPTSGSIRIGGQEIAGLNETRRTELRREHIGFVFQSYNLVPALSVADNITLPLRLAGRAPDREWLRTLVDRVGLGDRLSHRPAELSGGQQQRAAIVRALVAKPAVVFADEPTGARRLGCHHVINREEIGLSGSEPPADPALVGKRLGKLIRAATGEDPHIVFEHVGRATFGVSVFVVRRGGAVVTCGSSTGYQHEFDNRYLWMRLKRVIGSHGSNLHEQAAVGRLLDLGHLTPALTETYPLTDTAEAARLVQNNAHLGKVGVLALAPGPGLGVVDAERRERLTGM